MKVLITGSRGQLGTELVKEVKKRSYEVFGIDKDDADILDADAIFEKIVSIKPDAVIHCAAWTAVDLAENIQYKENVRKINVDGTKNIVHACKDIESKMLYISTDYVFDGKGTEPWKPEFSVSKSLNVYGQSKLDGELAVCEAISKFYIVRIAWLFGKNGINFVDNMLDIGKKHKQIKVVDDQIGTPTYAPDLARLLVDMVETNKYGYYHATNEGGYISWYDFACEIFRQAGYDTRVIPVSTAEYGLSKAVRPFNGRLNREKLIEYGFKPLPDWQDALRNYLKEKGVI